MSDSAVIFDTETTGKTEPILIEAAYLKMGTPYSLLDDAAKVDDGYIERFNPGKPIELGALATHHILDEELIDCRPASDFSLPGDIEYIIGHNVDYDWQVLGRPNLKRICTLALARDLFLDLDSYSQSALIYLFHRKQANVLLKNAHNALADVRLCRLILMEILKLIGVDQQTTWSDVWARSEQARIPKVITFGKHAGSKIEDLPKDYRLWVLTKSADFDPYLIQAVKNSLL